DELTGTQHRVPGTHGEPPGQHGRVVQLGDVPLVDVAQPVHQLAVPGLGGHDLHLGVLLPQVPPGAHERPGGPQPGHEVGDAGQVTKDLRPGRLVVRPGVALVAVLVEQYPAGVLRGDVLCLCVRLVRAAGRRGVDV